MRKTYILVITIIGLIVLSLYSTYAMFTADLNVGEFVNLTASSLPTDSSITEYERITLVAGKSKTIDLNITNSTSNSLYYGVWYEMIEPETINEDIHIGKLTGSSNPTIGQLASNGNTTVQIAIVNNSSDDIIINVGVGYSNTNSLNLPTNRSVITGEAAPEYIASDRIIQLAGNCTSWESGFSGVCATSAYEDNGVTKYHEYRYVGANVHNYVKFNDDMYQIIGVFDDNSHGVTGQWLVKLIAANPLGGFGWGVINTAPEYTTYSEYNNNWETANANILLNEYFLNATDTTSTYKSCSNWTYYHKDYKTKDCSKIIGYGIQTDNLRNYIEPVTWYLKGYSSYNYSKQNFYTCERSDSTTITNCTSGNSGAYATKVTNKSIGLMYVSDYIYASGYYSSTDTSGVGNYNYGQLNWLYNGWEWTITPQGSASTVAFNVYLGGVDYNNNNSYRPYNLRPTFYLKSTIKIKSGDGTFLNPFVIG